MTAPAALRGRNSHRGGGHDLCPRRRGARHERPRGRSFALSPAHSPGSKRRSCWDAARAPFAACASPTNATGVTGCSIGAAECRRPSERRWPRCSGSRPLPRPLRRFNVRHFHPGAGGTGPAWMTAKETEDAASRPPVQSAELSQDAGDVDACEEISLVVNRQVQDSWPTKFVSRASVEFRGTDGGNLACRLL